MYVHVCTLASLMYFPFEVYSPFMLITYDVNPMLNVGVVWKSKSNNLASGHVNCKAGTVSLKPLDLYIGYCSFRCNFFDWWIRMIDTTM